MITLLLSSCDYLLLPFQSNSVNYRYQNFLVRQIEAAEQQCRDGQTQLFTVPVIVLGDVNNFPIITDTPRDEIRLSDYYIYQIELRDPDPDNALFALPAQLGIQLVKVNLDNSRGGVAIYPCTLNVASDAPNQLPIIVPRSAFSTKAGQPSTYQIEASDPEILTLPYALEDSHTVQVAAFDSLGLGASQIYVWNARNGNQQSVLNHTLETAVLGNDPEVFHLNVVDPGEGGIQYKLFNEPVEMTIDVLDRLYWTPTAVDLGNQLVDFLVRDEPVLEYDLTVIVDATAPQILKEVWQTQIDMSELMTVQMRVVGDAGVASISLTVDGEAVVLDPNGAVSLSFDALGTVNYAATVINRVANGASDSVSVGAVDKGDVNTSVFGLLSPEFGRDKTFFVDVVRIAADDNLTSYTSTLTPFVVGLETVIATGNSENTANLLGQLDGTVLSNNYVLALPVEDAESDVSSTSTVVDVSRDLKIGSYTHSIWDIFVLLTGIAIVVLWTCDMLNANISSDFGYGWPTNLRDTDLADNAGKWGLEELGIYNSFFDGAKGYVILPSGEQEAFVFVSELRALLIETYYRSRFIAANGDNAGTLMVDRFDLRRAETNSNTTCCQIITASEKTIRNKLEKSTLSNQLQLSMLWSSLWVNLRSHKTSTWLSLKYISLNSQQLESRDCKVSINREVRSQQEGRAFRASNSG